MSACFNLTADILLILIPLPIYIRSQIPLRKYGPFGCMDINRESAKLICPRKITLCVMFSLGIFVVNTPFMNS